MEFGAGQHYILGEVITCSLSVLFCIHILLTFSAYDRRQRLFLYAGIATFLAAFFDICTAFCQSRADSVPPVLGKLVLTLFFAFLLVPPFVMSGCVLDMAFPPSRRKRLFWHVNGAVYALYLLAVILNWKTGWISSYQGNGGGGILTSRSRTSPTRRPRSTSPSSSSR